MPVGFQRTAIRPKTSLGHALKAARKKKHVSLDTAEHETKIRRHYLEALEEGRPEAIPPSHIRGFLRRYGEYLGIPPALIEQEVGFLNPVQGSKQPFSPRPLRSRAQWVVTPRLVAVAGSLLVLLFLLGYVIYQVRQFAAPPLLVVTHPSGDSVVTEETFLLEGKTDPGVLVTVDGLAATVKADGGFQYQLTLRPGLNQVTLRAENRIKKQTNKVVSLLYQAPATQVSPPPSP